MIQFFRKFRKNMADDNKPIKYMRYAIGEIVLVVVGILIALQVNNWNEQNNLKKVEVKLLHELKIDLEETKADLLTDVRKAKFELQFTDSLYQIISLNKIEDRPLTIDIPMFFLYQRSALYAKQSAYESLKSYGINLVSNDSLRKNITDFFELHLKRVNDIETIIKEINEKEMGPYLMRTSKSTDNCEGCTSLKELFSSRESTLSNFYSIDEPKDELIHLLKRKYFAYLALSRLYATTQFKIESLIQIIDSET